jgi:hypothetical protein
LIISKGTLACWNDGDFIGDTRVGNERERILDNKKHIFD